MKKKHSPNHVLTNSTHLRQRVIQHSKNNFSGRQIAAMLLLAMSTVYNWLKLYKEKGKAALEPQKRGRKVGSGRLLNPTQEEAIKLKITNNLPKDLKLDYSTWSRRAIADLVRAEYGIEIAVRTMGDYLKRWGFTPQKPAKRAYQRDEEKVDEWLNTTYPQIEAKAEEEGGVIHFGDEAGIHTEQINGRSYAPKGETPIIKSTGSRLKLNVISSLTRDGIMRFMTYFKTMNCRIFIQFMKQVIHSSAGQKVFLIVDNIRVHHGKMVTEWVSKHKNEIEIFYLPPYCPDLNPDEYLNHLMKQELQKRIQPHDKEELKTTMHRILIKLQRDPKKIQNLFQNKHILYASGKKKRNLTAANIKREVNSRKSIIHKDF
jgi:transposase